MAFGVKLREKEGQKLPTRYFSNKQERKVAKDLGAVQTPNSGATPWIKGDLLLEDLFLLEAKTKTTNSKSISIKKEWLEKNAKEALFMGKPYNALVFNFGPNERNYYIIDQYLMENLIEKLREEKSINK